MYKSDSIQGYALNGVLSAVGTIILFFMRTLTTTFHFGTNYGATLQAYALQQTIMSLGHENDILDIVEVSNNEAVLLSPKEIARHLYLKYLSFKRRRQIAVLRQAFVDFHKQRMHLTRAYVDMEDIRNDPKIQEYDCLITGSDQVWNLKTRPGFVDSRFLLFGSEKSRRFSYAASLEELNYSDEQKSYVANALKRFRGITIREESACKYVESFSGVKCKRVIDPVFLLDKEEWMKVAREPRLKGPYILCYQVQRNTRIEEVAYLLKKKTGLPVVSICNSAIKWMKSDYTFYDVSIEEFLGFYNQAAYIVSASFHGVAMGMVFEKPVYAMVKKERADRIRSIMTLMGLSDYIVVQGKNDEVREYKSSRLREMMIASQNERNKGIGFIKGMLS